MPSPLPRMPRRLANAVRYVEAHLQFTILEAAPIPSWQAKQDTYLLRTADAAYALKLFPIPAGTVRKTARALFGGLAGNNQIRMLSSLRDAETRHFKTPEFIATDGHSFVLTRYIPHADPQEAPADAPQRIAAALVEWQQLEISLRLPVRERCIRLVRSNSPPRVALRTTLNIARAYGALIAFRSLMAVFGCSIRSKRERHGWLEHGDFVASNEFFGADGHLYFVDFASARIVRSNRFADVVMHAVNYQPSHGITVDWPLIRAFAAKIQQSSGSVARAARKSPTLANDLRLALLTRTLHYVAKYDLEEESAAARTNDRRLLMSLIGESTFAAVLAAENVAVP